MTGTRDRHTSSRLALVLLAGLAPMLAGCFFGGSSAGPKASVPPKPTDVPFPDLADTPEPRPVTGAEEAETLIAAMRMRQLMSDLDRDVLPPDLLAMLPSPPRVSLTVSRPAILDRSFPTNEGQGLAPPPDAMPPVLPAGGGKDAE